MSVSQTRAQCSLQSGHESKINNLTWLLASVDIQAPFGQPSSQALIQLTSLGLTKMGLTKMGLTGFSTYALFMKALGRSPFI